MCNQSTKAAAFVKPFTSLRTAVPVCRQVSASRSAFNVVCQAAAVEAAEVAPEAAALKPWVPVVKAPKGQNYHASPLSQVVPPIYAIIEVGGSQMFVEPDKWYATNRLAVGPGSKIKFGRVLALKMDGKLTVGTPYLENVTVEADVIEEMRGPKIIVYKMKPKKHYRKKNGHRQDLSKFRVTSITAV
jgi:large subunit ribosomal protein L21